MSGVWEQRKRKEEHKKILCTAMARNFFLKAMRKLGIFLCCLSFGILAIVIGMAGMAQQLDMLKGSYYTSLYAYVNWMQWVCVGIIFCVGFYCYIEGK